MTGLILSIITIAKIIFTISGIMKGVTQNFIDVFKVFPLTCINWNVPIIKQAASPRSKAINITILLLHIPLSFTYLIMLPAIRTDNINPVIYPPVGPVITERPPFPPNTGSPTRPSNS